MKLQPLRNPRVKKMKKKSPPNQSDARLSFNEFQSIFSDKVQILDFGSFCDFLMEVKGQKDVINIAKGYSDNAADILDLVIQARRCVTSNNIKSRLKRLAVNLNKSINSELDLQFADYSQEDSSDTSIVAESFTDADSNDDSFF